MGHWKEQISKCGKQGKVIQKWEEEKRGYKRKGIC